MRTVVEFYSVSGKLLHPNKHTKRSVWHLVRQFGLYAQSEFNFEAKYKHHFIENANI